MTATEKNKILVHVCCASCASYVFSELEKEGFSPIAYFYNPEVHGRAEYYDRLLNLKKLCDEKKYEVVIPEYDIQDFLSLLVPYHDQRSIKYIADKRRYRRKRCQLCIELLLSNLANYATEIGVEYFSTTMLCSPYKDHNEIWDRGTELAASNNLNFFYKDFRKGYWTGRNYARSHQLSVPGYCGCAESLDEGRLE